MGRIALFLLGLSIVLAIHIWEGGTMGMLFHPGAALLCILCPFLLGLVLYRTDLVRALSAACRREPSEVDGFGRHLEVISGLRMLCIALGALGFLVSTGLFFVIDYRELGMSVSAMIGISILVPGAFAAAGVGINRWRWSTLAKQHDFGLCLKCGQPLKDPAETGEC